MHQELDQISLQPLAQRHLPAPRQRHGPGQRRRVKRCHHVRPRRTPRRHRIVSGRRSRIGRTIYLVVPGRVGLNRPQLTYHVTGDIDGAPALARRRRIPAVRCNPGKYGLKAIERANETIQNHVIQYLYGRPAPCSVRCR